VTIIIQNAMHIEICNVVAL